MVSHFIRIFIRTIFRQKIHYTINVLGLSIGLGASLYLYFYCHDELTFDRFHPSFENIVKIVDMYTFSEQPVNSATVSAPMGPAVVAEFPEAELVVRLNKVTGILRALEDDHDFQFEKILIADSGFFHLFGFRLLDGNPRTVLTQPNSIVLTESTARKIFGDTNPVGKSLQTNLLGGQTMMVTGLMEDASTNSHIQFDLLVSHTSMINIVPTLQHWLVYGTHTYLRLKPNTPLDIWRSRFKELVAKNVPPEFASKYDHHLAPISQLHLDISRRGDMEPTGNRIVIMILQAVMALITLLSLANFISLSLSLATDRVREAGVRKVLGGSSNQVGFQIIFETVLICMGSAILGLIILTVALPFINTLCGKNFMISDLTSVSTLACLVALAIAIGIISGTFPALFLRGLSIQESLKKATNGMGAGKQLVRQGMVIFQFAIVIALLISVDVLNKQTQFLHSQSLGFAKEGVVVVPINSPAIAKSRITLLDQFKDVPGVLSATTTSAVPSKNFSFGPFRLEGGDIENNAIFNIGTVDTNYAAAMNLQLAAGRTFDPNAPTDSSAFVVNQAVLSILGIASPEESIGKILEMHGANNSGPLKKGPIIGVIQNFHYKSLREEIEPLVMHIGKGGYSSFLIKIETKNSSEILEQLQEKWKALEPGQSMIFSFLDEDLKNLYRSEEKLDGVFEFFTTLTIVIACIGLFGLSSYTMIRKAKEISIRKVFGAETQNIVTWIGSSFLKLIGLSAVAGVPLAIWGGNQWLQTFAYHINIELDSVVNAIALSIIILFATVGYHLISHAMTSPIKNLRND